MVYIIKKGKKFMEGHGYAIGIYNFTWTFNKMEARKFSKQESIDGHAKFLASIANAKVVRRKDV